MVVASAVAFVLFCVSSYFAFLGLWLVFPFAGLEVALLFYCFYLRIRANFNTEVIIFNEDSVTVERGYNHAEESWEYQRLWTKFFVKNPTIRGYPKQIFIRSHGKELEIGSFLNKSDKEILIKDLKDVVYA